MARYRIVKKTEYGFNWSRVIVPIETFFIQKEYRFLSFRFWVYLFEGYNPFTRVEWITLDMALEEVKTLQKIENQSARIKKNLKELKTQRKIDEKELKAINRKARNEIIPIENKNGQL